MKLTLMQALRLIEATDRVGREPGDDLRAALGVVAEAGLAAPDPQSEPSVWVARAREALAELKAASGAHAVGEAWGRIRALLRERAKR